MEYSKFNGGSKHVEVYAGGARGVLGSDVRLNLKLGAEVHVNSTDIATFFNRFYVNSTGTFF